MDATPTPFPSPTASASSTAVSVAGVLGEMNGTPPNRGAPKANVVRGGKLSAAPTTIVAVLRTSTFPALSAAA